LHKCGKITLGEMDINRNENEPKIWDGENWELPLADVPMPENVKDFESIHLWFV
jgi:hypothetical protein